MSRGGGARRYMVGFTEILEYTFYLFRLTEEELQTIPRRLGSHTMKRTLKDSVLLLRDLSEHSLDGGLMTPTLVLDKQRVVLSLAPSLVHNTVPYRSPTEACC
jgi:hypothetical protein